MGIGFVAKIVTIIIKSAVNSKIGSELGKELIGTSIDEVSERSITEINNFISGKKSKLEHILSEEKMKEIYVAEENIDFVIAELKDLLSKVEITDELFRRCRYNPENLKDILWNEYRRDKNIIENESDIEKGLDIVAETLIELVLESEEFEKDLIIHISNTVDDIRLEIKDDSSNMMKRFDRLEKGNQAILDKVSENSSTLNKDKAQRKIESRTKEYADKWDANMFLNDFSDWDENAGINIKLKDVYIEDHLPHFIWRNNNKVSFDLKILLSKYILDNGGKNQMLLILGQPGIGKSTLITWITANFTNRINDIFVYKFADDLADIDWKNTSEKHNIADVLLMKLGFSYNELDGKTLIIDGFDEISIQGRIVILNRLFWQLIKATPLNNFSLIITSRENYIQDLHKSNFDYITLQSWDMEQIRSFCSIFQKKTKNSISESTIKKLLKNKEILGVPLILYRR